MKPELLEEIPAESRVIFGLGNPGPPYEWTPHNAGFMVLSELASRWGASFEPVTPRLQVAPVSVDGGSVLLVRPLTYMNRSGDGLRDLLERVELDWERFCVVTDDWDLPLGQLRIRPAGGAGTHNGMRSLLEVRPLGDFPRLRLGIRPETVVESLREYVLAPAAPTERQLLLEGARRAAEALLAWVGGRGLNLLMTQFNGSVLQEK